MSEKLTAKEYAEKLLYTPEYAADKQADVKEKAAAFAEGYKKFMDSAKTEREAAVVSEQMLLAAGYKAFEPKKAYAPGEKVYFIQENKAVVAATIGQKPYEEGFRLVIAHIDCPRLDLRPNPLYESDHMSYFRTHYYGGIRKYQWATIPLAIHGVFTRADGSSVNFAVGEDENDPVFCITDLLPHLGAEQNERKLSEGIKGEELNVLIGSDTVEEEDVKEAVKLNTLILLNQKYGITERDFTRAEIEVVPAAKARDVGFDRSMIGAYGHDDRVDAYPALLAEIETKDPVRTTICVLTDKEEIGSDGVTGMQSMYVFHFMQLLCRAAGQDDILAFRNSVCLSADVTAAYDPSWASAFEKQNGTYAGRGIAILSTPAAVARALPATPTPSWWATSPGCWMPTTWHGSSARWVVWIWAAAVPLPSMWQTAASRCWISACPCCPCTLPSRSSTRPTCTWLTAPSACSASLRTKKMRMPQPAAYTQ